MKVFVYFNLHKKCFFVTNDETPVYKGIVAHLTTTNKTPKIEAHLEKL